MDLRTAATNACSASAAAGIVSSSTAATMAVLRRQRRRLLPASLRKTRASGHGDCPKRRSEAVPQRIERGIAH